VYSGVLYAVGEQALVIKSEGGAGARDWAAQAVPVASRYSLAACSFMNSTHGWAVGRYGTIMATMDGGDGWVLRGVGLDSTIMMHDVAQQPVQRTEWGQPIGHTGVVLAVGSGGVILRSLDYGQTWGSVNSLSTGNLNAVAWASPTVAYVVGDNGRVLVRCVYTRPPITKPPPYPPHRSSPTHTLRLLASARCELARDSPRKIPAFCRFPSCSRDSLNESGSARCA